MTLQEQIDSHCEHTLRLAKEINALNAKINKQSEILKAAKEALEFYAEGEKQLQQQQRSSRRR